jgi:hypothetical protein
MRAPDVWDSARFQAVFVAWGWFRQIGVISARPAAGNASRWAFPFRGSIAFALGSHL